MDAGLKNLIDNSKNREGLATIFDRFASGFERIRAELFQKPAAKEDAERNGVADGRE